MRVTVLFAVALAHVTLAQGDDTTFAARRATIDGTSIYYRMGGSGPAVVLLHGYAQTSRMWSRVMPQLARKFTVIVPDLPGIGESAIPATGLDILTAAKRMHALVQSLGMAKARVVGHDIGLMVAYAYAAQYPGDVEKLAML
ncbi:MAG TPA: alpha/beta fold hydrolase, partial [Gemmatimonadaceae bacterium]|nr:alpha/beta fold hydrolase [Gemmatimonadaceae bacterium]